MESREVGKRAKAILQFFCQIYRHWCCHFIEKCYSSRKLFVKFAILFFDIEAHTTLSCITYWTYFIFSLIVNSQLLRTFNKWQNVNWIYARTGSETERNWEENKLLCVNYEFSIMINTFLSWIQGFFVVLVRHFFKQYLWHK